MSGDELDEADEMELSGERFVEHPGVRLDAADIIRRARDAYGPDGRPRCRHRRDGRSSLSRPTA